MVIQDGFTPVSHHKAKPSLSRGATGSRIDSEVESTRPELQPKLPRERRGSRKDSQSRRANADDESGYELG